ncbi:MAG: phosphatidate cytidylyltransferase [Treponema sp.]|nr:phosphatidate cytidylyltransferase [Treponema sp.]
MDKIGQRLLIFLAGIPAILSLVLLLPQANHLAMNLVAVLLCSLGGIELSLLLSKWNLVISKPEAAVLGGLLPAAALIRPTFGPASVSALVLIALTCGLAWLLLSRLLSGAKALPGVLGGVVAGLAVLVYPGLFMSWVVRMSLWENAGPAIAVFLAMVFSGDSLAWAAGMLFGKGNRGIVPASPNKSIAGFVGGLIAPVIVGIACIRLFPDIYRPSALVLSMGRLPAGFLLGFCTGAAAILGDLAESALKRSSGVKDSGAFFAGRGGVLDSVDSIAMAAPAYYVLFGLFFAG